MKVPEVGQGKRMLVDRGEVGPPATRRIAPPCLPGGEEVEAEAESRLEHGEALGAGPALRQAVAGKKYMLRLREASGCAVVDVAEARRIRDRFLEGERCRNERLRG